MTRSLPRAVLYLSPVSRAWTLFPRGTQH